MRSVLKARKGSISHNFPLLIGKQKHPYNSCHHYHLQQNSANILVAARNFSALQYSQQREKKGRAMIQPTNSVCHSPNAENSTERITAYPSLYAQHLAGFDTFLYAKKIFIEL